MMTFDITDRRGVAHTYNVRYHDASDGPEGGATISLRLIAAGIEPLGRIIAETLKAVQDNAEIKAKIVDALTNPASVVQITDLIDSATVARFAADARAVMMSGAIDAKLVRAIIANAWRDGVRLSSSDAAWNEAFNGNYVEMYTAAVRIAQENGFFPLPGT